MKRQSLVVYLTACLVCCGLTNTFADDSFLQKPFKSYLFESSTYPEGVQELSRIIGKPVTIPDDATDFVKEINSWNTGFRVPIWMRIGRGSRVPTLRDVLDQTASSLGMKWNYDPIKDRVVLDFSWRRNDSRSSTELVHVLQDTPSIISQQDQRYYWTNDHLPPDATWQIAFDALLSKASSTSNVWKIRLADDLKRGMIPELVINLLSAKIKDSTGNEHLLILNDQPLMISPGEGSFSYYVFDLNGKFEQGGLFHSGYRCEAASAWAESDESRLTLRVFFNESGKMDEHFTLTSKGLVLNDVLDYQLGQTLSANSQMLAQGLHMGIPLFHLTD